MLATRDGKLPVRLHRDPVLGVAAPVVAVWGIHWSGLRSLLERFAEADTAMRVSSAVRSLAYERRCAALQA
jgi:hypothetical protein